MRFDNCCKIHLYNEIKNHEMKNEYKCKVCGDDFKSDEELSENMRYCGYCAAVHLGDPDPSWLPSIKRDEIDEKGFHKL